MNVRLEIQLANKPGALVRVLGLAERRGRESLVGVQGRGEGLRRRRIAIIQHRDR